MTRVRAPRLRGRGWLNTGGRPVTLDELRGKIVILDFWTFCCLNCLHVLDELRPLEERFADVLVIVGVHSPKFEHERDAAALADAVERYGVTHPVLDDPELITWDQYAAKAWPTLSVVDPEGYVVATMAGEGHAAGLASLIEELVEVHAAKGTLHRGDGPYVPPPAPATELRFPGKALARPGGSILVADSAHHSIVEMTPDGSVLRRIGDGVRGRTDDPPRFAEPGGLCLLPPSVAAVVGYDVVVADTVNHLLRGLSTATGAVTTICGTGNPWRSLVETQDALAVDLSSPWDVAWFDDRVIIAMAGIHQLWWFSPVSRTAGVYAGTTVEALRDGPLPDVWLAQPSGLSAAGDTLWIVDAESSALRYVRDGSMHTVVGQGLFDFGHLDGPASSALLQHPLGVLALPSGPVLVADTYNGAIRRYDPPAFPASPASSPVGTVSTVASGLAEPSDLVLLSTGSVLVVESAAHRVVPLPAAAAESPGTRHRLERAPTRLAPGEVSLDVIFSVAPGQKLDATFGPSTRLTVTASPPSLLVSGAGTSTDLSRPLVLSASVTQGVLQVVAQAATCDVQAEHPACYLTRQDWGVPVVVAADGASRLPLILRGLDPAAAPPSLTL